jgi:hypothetical protein
MQRELRPAVFLHIQKTAGTSVQEMARQAYGNDNVISHGDYERLGLEACKSIPFVSGHFGFAFAEALMPGRYSFTFLRNPFDRLISLYRFCLTRPAAEHPIYEAAHAGNFEDFLERKHSDIHWASVWNNQTTQLHLGWGARILGLPPTWPWEFTERELLEGAVAHLARFDHVGFQETFSADVRHIFDALGAPYIAERHSNVAASRSVYRDLPIRTKLKLYEVNKLDWMLYEEAVAKHATVPYPIPRTIKINSRLARIGMQVREVLSPRSGKPARK